MLPFTRDLLFAYSFMSTVNSNLLLLSHTVFRLVGKNVISDAAIVWWKLMNQIISLTAPLTCGMSVVLKKNKNSPGLCVEHLGKLSFNILS